MPIANFFIKRIIKAYRDLNHYDEDDIDVIRFALEAILWEVEKILYLAAIFIMLGYGWQFLASAVAFISIRQMTGGFHASTAWRCFGWTLFGFALAIIVLPSLIILNTALIIFLGVSSLAVTAIAAPIYSAQMESVANRDKDKLKKSIAIILTVILFVLFIIHNEHFLVAVAAWAIFLQNLQLLIVWAYRRKT